VTTILYKETVCHLLQLHAIEKLNLTFKNGISFLHSRRSVFVANVKNCATNALLNYFVYWNYRINIPHTL